MIAKEFRALLPAWLAAAAVMLAASAGPGYHWMAMPAFLIGTASIGALTVGHEYSHGTMGTLLMLPVPRWRLWAVKLSVAGGMLTALSMLAAWTLLVPAEFSRAVYVLSATAGLFVASWLTLLSGSALAGAVFTLGAAGILMVALEAIGVRRFGYTADVDAFRMTFMIRTCAALSVCGAVLGWRRFVRLEAPDDRRAHVQFTLRSRPARRTLSRHHPVWALVNKELRLQQLPVVLAALYVVWFVMVRQGAGALDRDTVIPLTFLYSGLEAILIGCLASAEERQLGTHDSQMLLPVTSSRQWLVKALTALTLAFVLARALPAGLAAFAGTGGQFVVSVRDLLHPRTTVMVLGATAMSLYISTTVNNALRALLISMPAVVALWWFMGSVALRVAVAVLRAVKPLWIVRQTVVPQQLVGFALVAAVLALALRFALDNDRWGKPGVVVLAIHLVTIAFAIVAAFTASGLLGVLG